MRTERGAQSAGADGVEDRSPDALRGEAVERHPTRLVVAAGGLHQTEGAGRGQFLTVDVTGEVHRHLEDHMTHERQVLLDEPLDVGVVQAGHRPSSTVDTFSRERRADT